MKITSPVFSTLQSTQPADSERATAASNPTNRSPADFSDLLHNTDNRPARKSTSGRSYNSTQGGNVLPPSGNHPPLHGAQLKWDAEPHNGSSPMIADARGGAHAVDGGGTAQAGAAVDGLQGQAGAVGKKNDVAVTPGTPDATNAGVATTAAPVALPVAAGLASAASASLAHVGAGVSAGTVFASAAGIAQTVKTSQSPGVAAAKATAKAGADAGADKAENSRVASGSSMSNNAASSLGTATASTGADATPQTPLAAIVAAVAASAPQGDSTLAPVAEATTPPCGIKAQNAMGADANAAAVTASFLRAVAAAVTHADSTIQQAAGLAGTDATEKQFKSEFADVLSTVSSSDGSAGAAQLMAASPPPAADPGGPMLKVGAPVDSAEFGQGVTDKISLMIDSNMNTAKLHANPASLGPIEVRIAVQGNHAQVWMTSHSALTRDALEYSAPQLREMLNGQGFTQVSVDISQRSFQERTPQNSSHPQGRGSDRADYAAPLQAAAASSRIVNGGLDAYA